MKKVKKYSVITSPISVDKNQTYMFVTLSEDLFDKKYSSYQRAFILHILKNNKRVIVKADTKQKIWFKTIDSKKRRLPYEDEIKQLEIDGFIESVTNDRFGYITYELCEKSEGWWCLPFSETELSILQRGL